jgi:hypothetical protein
MTMTYTGDEIKRVPQAETRSMRQQLTPVGRIEGSQIMLAIHILDSRPRTMLEASIHSTEECIQRRRRREGTTVTDTRSR